MNRFNGLCKVCSERRYRQVGARPFEGRPGCHWRVRVGGLASQDFSPLWPSLSPPAPCRSVCDLGGGQRQEEDLRPSLCPLPLSLSRGRWGAARGCPNRWPGGVPQEMRDWFSVCLLCGRVVVREASRA